MGDDRFSYKVVRGGYGISYFSHYHLLYLLVTGLFYLITFALPLLLYFIYLHASHKKEVAYKKEIKDKELLILKNKDQALNN